MQRRTILIIVGSVLAATLLICGVVGGIGWYALRQVGQQQQAISDMFASTLAELEATPDTETSAAPSASAAPATTVPTTEATTAASPSADATAAPPASTASADIPPVAADVASALVPGSRARLAERSGATRYEIDATLDPAQRTIAGTQTIMLQNTEDSALGELYFRLYVNAPHYSEGGIEVSDVQVDGAGVQSSLEDDDTALKLALPAPLAPGAEATVTMRFTTTVPTSGGGYGIFNASNGVFTLYNWHPELAVYEDGGWLLNPVTEQGDPTNTDAANYVVRFGTPADYTVITSGTESGTDEAASADGTVTHVSTAALARNFVVVAGDRFEQQSQQVGDTKVTSYYLPDSAEGGKTALDTTVKSLDVFGEAFGPYPYSEMDVAQVDLLGGAAGMESTGLIMIGSDLYGAEGGNPLGDLGASFPGGEGGNALIFTTAHEAAHQWWYGVVGSDAYQQPWLDESLTNWSSAYYVDQVAGDDAGALARDIFIGFGYRSVLAEGDQRLDQPVDAFDSEGYSGVVYGKGALMYDVLRQELGDITFFEFLKRYYAEQQFDRADSGEWLATLNAVAGKDMTPFYQKWVEGSNVTAQDLPPAGPLSTLLGGFDAVLPEGSPAP